MATDQPLAFAALVAGGLLITAGLSGYGIADVAQGKVHDLRTPSGQASTTGGLATTAHGLVNPFTGDTVHAGRVDMGQDFNLAPGDPIRALGTSRVAGVLPGWYAGQPLVYFQLLNETGGTSPTAASPYAGRFWYVAEQINPSVRVGQVVQAGEEVARYAASGTGIEIGWATSTGRTAAAAAGDVNPTTHYSREGQEFADLLRQLGVVG